jgi:hypothetical protein
MLDGTLACARSGCVLSLLASLLILSVSVLCDNDDQDDVHEEEGTQEDQKDEVN